MGSKSPGGSSKDRDAASKQAVERKAASKESSFRAAMRAGQEQQAKDDQQAPTTPYKRHHWDD